MRLVQWGSLLLASLSLCSSAIAEENPWIPSFSGWGGVIHQKATGSATSTSDQRDDINGASDLTFGFVGLSAELMTPKLRPVPGAPALFVHGDTHFALASTWDVAKERAPGKVTNPITPIGLPVPGRNATGIGTAQRVQPEQSNFGAGIGVAFEIPVGDRTVRLRPSLEYRYDSIGYQLKLSDSRNIADPLCPCGVVELSGRDEQDFHSIGPGVEVEFDAARAGPVMLTLFASLRGYAVLSERETRLTVSGDYVPAVPAPNDSVSATAHFKRELWTFQGGFGLRFRWMPE